MHTYECEVLRWHGDPDPQTIKVHARSRRHAEKIVKAMHPSMIVCDASRISDYLIPLFTVAFTAVYLAVSAMAL